MTALSDPKLGRGAVPCPADFLTSILPGLLLFRLAGEMPPLREGDRYFWGCAFRRSGLLSCRFFLFETCETTVPGPVLLCFLTSWLTQLVYEAAHTNIHNHPQRQEHEQHGRPTITHQRQGYSGDRHKANHHADIDQDMEAKHSHHTHHHERASAVGRCLRVLRQTHQHNEV